MAAAPAKHSSIAVKHLVEQYGANLQTGLTTDQASQRREESGSFNVVRPPVDCPGWVCCLLPCIKGIPSMKAFASTKPEDAEVLRNSKWIRYDATSLVTGDTIRLEEGDVVPADCTLVEMISGDELLVDLRQITGEERLKSLTASSFDQSNNNLPKLYMGGQVVQGGAIGIVTAIGPDTLLAKLIEQKRFPPKEEILLDEMSGSAGDGDFGIAMGDVA